MKIEKLNSIGILISVNLRNQRQPHREAIKSTNYLGKENLRFALLSFFAADYADFRRLKKKKNKLLF